MSYTIVTPYATYKNVELSFDRYQSNNRLAIQAYNNEDGPIATISVNLPSEKISDPDHEFFVDVNNCPWAEDFLQENGIAVPVYAIGFSGWCAYPLYSTDIEKWKEEEEEEVIKE